MTDACSMCLLVDGDDATLRSLARPALLEAEHWRGVLNGPDQRYPGRSILVARRHVAAVPDLRDDEWRELRQVMARFETAARRAFGATLANWGCLMNHAFQSRPARPHVHWHFRPRYATPVSIAGLVFDDEVFGRHYSREYRPLEEPVLFEIRDRLRRELESLEPDRG